MKKRKREEKKQKYVSSRQRAEKHASADGNVLKVPDGLMRYDFKKAGVHRFNVLPYKVGKGNPMADEGQYGFERTFHAHRNIGAAQTMVICNAKSFGKPCPVCEYAGQERAKGDKIYEELKVFNTTERQAFLIQDLDDRANIKNPKLFTISFHGFGKLLDERVKAFRKYENFHHIEGGLILNVTVTEESVGNGKYYKATAIDFEKRKSPLDSALVKSLPCLDDMVAPADYKTLKKLFLGGIAVPEDEDDDMEDDDDIDDGDSDLDDDMEDDDADDDDLDTEDEDDDDADDDEDFDSDEDDDTEDDDDDFDDMDEDEEDDDDIDLRKKKKKVLGKVKKKKVLGKVKKKKKNR